MGACDGRTQGAPLAALAGRLRTPQRACPARSGGPCSFCWSFLETLLEAAAPRPPGIDAVARDRLVARIRVETERLWLEPARFEHDPGAAEPQRRRFECREQLSPQPAPARAPLAA